MQNRASSSSQTNPPRKLQLKEENLRKLPPPIAVISQETTPNKISYTQPISPTKEEVKLKKPFEKRI